jgi:hypothetical protein
MAQVMLENWARDRVEQIPFTHRSFNGGRGELLQLDDEGMLIARLYV